MRSNHAQSHQKSAIFVKCGPAAKNNVCTAEETWLFGPQLQHCLAFGSASVLEASAQKAPLSSLGTKITILLITLFYLMSYSVFKWGWVGEWGGLLMFRLRVGVEPSRLGRSDVLEVGS